MGLGWIVGEEILFNLEKKELIRFEKCTSINEAGVLQVAVSDLTKMASSKQGGGGTLKNDYKVLLSYLEKNYGVKTEWRKKAGIIQN